MKRIVAIALLAIANFAMAGTSFAQSKWVRADVPFGFTVGSEHLPAGTYTFKTESEGLIAIKNHDKPIAVFTIVDRDSAKAPKRRKADVPQVRRPVLLERDSLRLAGYERHSPFFQYREDGSAAAGNGPPEQRGLHCCPVMESLRVGGPRPNQTSGLLTTLFPHRWGQAGEFSSKPDSFCGRRTQIVRVWRRRRSVMGNRAPSKARSGARRRVMATTCAPSSGDRLETVSMT
jgi:hypothetical protein